MNNKYKKNVMLFKALADTNRLIIVNMISCGEICACKILEKLGITQPTLSHHMKILCDCGLVKARKDRKWIYYSLNERIRNDFISFFNEITALEDNCICND